MFKNNIKDRRARNRRLPRIVASQSGKCPKIESELELARIVDVNSVKLWKSGRQGHIKCTVHNIYLLNLFIIF